MKTEKCVFETQHPFRICGAKAKWSIMSESGFRIHFCDKHKELNTAQDLSQFKRAVFAEWESTPSA